MNHRQNGRLGGAVLVATALMAGCEVTNPGPIQDAFLAEEAAQPGLIYGAQRSIATNHGARMLDFGLMAREIFPGGQTGAWGTDVQAHAGNVPEFDGPGFTGLHEARFITETAIARFTLANASNDRLFEAWLWNGIAYRLLGEWWCDAVLPTRDPTNTDPPAFHSNTVNPYFERAVESFTTALTFASTQAQRDQANAGLAQAQLWLGQWQAAYNAANLVSNTAFQIVIEQNDAETATYNYIYEGNSGVFRSFTTRFTWFEQYYDSTTDPRVPSSLDPSYPVAVGSLSGYGQVPYRPQRKYRSRNDPFQLVDYWELQLLKSEAILRGAAPAGGETALDLINEVRTRTGVAMAAVTAANAQETWAHLITERRIELWLEGRNAPDERRWARTPPFAGANLSALLNIPSWETVGQPGYSTLFVQNPRGLEGRGSTELCYDIPQAERDRNPNVPAVGR